MFTLDQRRWGSADSILVVKRELHFLTHLGFVTSKLMMIIVIYYDYPVSISIARTKLQSRPLKQKDIVTTSTYAITS